MKHALKKWLKRVSPFALSKNHYYDIFTRKIIARHCAAGSNCIDVGCHEGEVLDLFIKYCPQGHHFAFEPLPRLFNKLITRYKDFPLCDIYEYALSDKNGTTGFNHVITNPAYSGIKKRKYDRPHEKDETITVATKRMDDVIPANIPVSLIKIDVERGELDVLKGAVATIERSGPLIIFEAGIGGSDMYGTTADGLYQFMQDRKYTISLLDSFYKHKPSLSPEEFRDQFEMKKNYYFIAHR